MLNKLIIINFLEELKMGYKKFIDDNHYVDDNLGNDILNGIGDGLKVGKMLGLDKQAKKDIKRLKGYSDTEISQMDLPALRKECKKFHVKSIIVAICAAILVMVSLADVKQMGGFLVFGIIAGIIALRFYNQYKKFKAKIDEYTK